MMYLLVGDLLALELGLGDKDAVEAKRDTRRQLHLGNHVAELLGVHHPKLGRGCALLIDGQKKKKSC